MHTFLPMICQIYYEVHLPTQAFDYYSSLDPKDKYDAIIVDEGQDFKEDWITCLEAMLKEDGEFYIFADPNQDLFHSEIENLNKMQISRHKLTRNLRNTEEINSWMQKFVPEGWLKACIPGGHPVAFFVWDTPEEERRLIEKEVGRLVSQGIKPERIVILCPNKREKSSLAEVSKIKGFPIVNITN